MLSFLSDIEDKESVMKLMSLVIVLIAFKQAFAFDCNYTMKPSMTLGDICTYELGKSEAQDKLMLNGPPDISVLAFIIQDLEIEKLPHALGTKFTRLKLLYLENVSISNLYALKLPNLEILTIKNSKISFPRGTNLFKVTSKLQKVFLMNNTLDEIEYEIFNNLTKLEIVDLSGNKCVNENFDFLLGREQVKQSLKHTLSMDCLPVNKFYCFKSEKNESSFECRSRVLKAHNLRLKPKECNVDQVEMISILDYQVERFPDKFFSKSNLKNVKHLIINGRISRLIAKDLRFNQKLQTLDLSNNNISELRSNVFEFTPNLETLVLSQNRIKSIGVSIFNRLNKLNVVVLSGNEDCSNEILLKKDLIPDLKTSKVKASCKLSNVISCLVVISDFFFVGSVLTCVAQNVNFATVDKNVHGPKVIDTFIGSKNIANSKALAIRDQVCNYLPIMESPHIELVSVVNSGLSELLDETFEGIPNIKSFVASSNKISFLDLKIFESAKNLIHVDLSDNQLTAVNSQDLTFSLVLRNILLDQNICIDDNFNNEAIQNIMKLLETCKFVEIRCHYKENDTCDVTSSMTEEHYDYELKFVAVDKKNYISENFKKLEVVNQTFYRIPKNFGKFLPNLESLIIIRSYLSVLKSSDLEGLSNLKEIVLTHNKLTTLEKDLFKYTKYLETIDLSHNKLSFFQVNLKLLTSLTHLHLISAGCINKTTKGQNVQDIIIDLARACESNNYHFNFNYPSKIRLFKPIEIFKNEAEEFTSLQSLLQNLNENKLKSDKLSSVIDFLAKKYGNCTQPYFCEKLNIQQNLNNSILDFEKDLM